MGQWYKVTKKIHGRLYDYWQRTERQGKRVKTFNKYIGPHTRSTVVSIDGSTIAAPRILAQSTENITTVHDIERQIALVRRKIDETAEQISNGLPDREWHQAQNILTANYAELSKLEDTLGKSIRNHLDNTLLPLLKELGVKPNDGSAQPPIPTGPQQTTPEDAMYHFDPLHNPDGVNLRQYKKFVEKERRENERLRYGNLKDRIARHEAAVKKAKRKSSGTGAENPFIGKILRKKPRDKT
jgi:hypothetical protein